MKNRNYYWKDVLRDLYEEGTTARDEVQGTIEFLEMLGGEYAEKIPALKEIDEALVNKTVIKRDRRKIDPKEQLLHLTCGIVPVLDKIYKNAKHYTTPNENGSFTIHTELTKEEKDRATYWKLIYYALHTSWERISWGEDYDSLQRKIALD